MNASDLIHDLRGLWADPDQFVCRSTLILGLGQHLIPVALCHYVVISSWLCHVLPPEQATLATSHSCIATTRSGWAVLAAPQTDRFTGLCIRKQIHSIAGFLPHTHAAFLDSNLALSPLRRNHPITFTSPL